MSRVRRWRERLVLGHLVPTLDDGEGVLAWAHARVPGTRSPGVLVVTERRCLLHLASRDVDDTSTPWVGLTRWSLEHPTRARATLTLCTQEGEAVTELTLNSRARATSASRLLAAIGECTAVPCEQVPYASDGRRSLHRFRRPRPPTLTAAPRGPRDHARRVGVTVLGVLVLIVSAIFASPLVPGPGALTAVAGIAILAREYEWARDLHVWATRQLERFLSWMRRRKQALFPGRVGPPLEEPQREAAKDAA